MKSLTIGGTTVQLADDALAAVAPAVDALTAKLTDATAELAEVQKRLADSDKEKALADAKIAELEEKLKDAEEAKLNDEDIKGILDAADKLRTKAKALAGADFVCDSIDPMEIMKAAIAKAVPTANLADKSFDYVAAFFDARLSSVNDATASHKALGDALKTADETKVKDAKPDAYAKMLADTTSAWKRPETSTK